MSELGVSAAKLDSHRLPSQNRRSGGPPSSHACRTVSRVDDESALRGLGAFTHSFHQRHLPSVHSGHGPDLRCTEGTETPPSGRHPPSREAVRPLNVMMIIDKSQQRSSEWAELEQGQGGPKAGHSPLSQELG